MAQKKKAKAEAVKTSLSLDPAVYRRAWNYKLDTKRSLGAIVSEALDEYLKNRHA